MMHLTVFKPTHIAPAAEAITPEALQVAQLGEIKVILWDFGGTLAEHSSKELEVSVTNTLLTLQNAGLVQIIHSNAYGRNVAKLEHIATSNGLALAVLTPSAVTPKGETPKNYAKPRPDMIKKVMAEYAVQPHEILVIGDQMTKDVWAANRIGARSILLPRRGKGDDWRIWWLQRPVERILSWCLRLPATPRRLLRVTA